MSKDFKILSLDGGGYKGLFTIACLAEIEKCCDIKVQEYFDLYAGTSTGSIIATGLAAGFTAEEILNLYKKNINEFVDKALSYIDDESKGINRKLIP